MSTTPLNLSPRRLIVGIKALEWQRLSDIPTNVNFNEEKDIFWWDLQRHGIFLVKYMYNLMMTTTPRVHHNWLWKLKLPLKIKIFLWYLGRGVILTEDNLLKMQMER
jgi:hypothetical protein